MSRQNFSSGATWEPIIGYSRAVRIGNTVAITGTASVDENGKTVGTTFEDQTRFILQKIKKYLELAGARLEDVIRTRIFTTNMDQWQSVGKVHGEFFLVILNQLLQ